MKVSRKSRSALAAAALVVGLGPLVVPASAATPDADQVIGTVDQATAPYLATYYGRNVSYGHLRSDSNCSNATSLCSIRFTDNSDVARPAYTGLVKYCGKYGVVDGTTIGEAISSRKLIGRYVGVLWGGTGAEGALNCH